MFEGLLLIVQCRLFNKPDRERIPIILAIIRLDGCNNGKNQPYGSHNPKQKNTNQQQEQNEADCRSNGYGNIEIDGFLTMKIDKSRLFFLNLPHNERSNKTADNGKETG